MGLGTIPGTTRLVSPRWERLSLVWRQDKEWWREETGSLHIFKDKWYPGIVRFEQWRKSIPWGRGIDREWRVCHQPGSFQGVCGGSEWEAPLLSFSYLLLHWFPKEAWRKLIRQPGMRSEAGRKARIVNSLTIGCDPEPGPKLHAHYALLLPSQD